MSPLHFDTAVLRAESGREERVVSRVMSPERSLLKKEIAWVKRPAFVATAVFESLMKETAVVLIIFLKRSHFCLMAGEWAVEKCGWGHACSV